MGTCEESAAVSGVAAAAGPSLGLLHAAGVLMDATLANQTPAHVRSVFAPKSPAVDGLDQVSPPSWPMRSEM